jgi:hypothetical protein
MSDPADPFQNRNELKDHLEMTLAHAKQAHDWLDKNGTPNALVAQLRAELAARDELLTGAATALRDLISDHEYMTGREEDNLARGNARDTLARIDAALKGGE